MKFLIPALLLASVASAEVPAPDMIKNLAGCFTVDYRFVENGKNDKNILGALEWITLKADGDTHVIQHYGILTDETGKEEIMKHFGERWTALPTGGWEQKVVSPAGAPRYTCKSDVRFSQLRCQSKGAPKPQRDRHRKDYDVLNRDTSIQITPKGWVQAEVNDKVKNDKTVIATEVGWVEYKRTDEKACENAKKQFPQG